MGEVFSMDLVFIGMAAAFFAASYGLVMIFERLMEG